MSKTLKLINLRGVLNCVGLFQLCIKIRDAIAEIQPVRKRSSVPGNGHSVFDIG